MSTLYPLFLSLRGRDCVVVGGNEMAEAKVRDLLEADAKVRVIAPVATGQIIGWSQAGRLHWEARAYEPGDVRDAFLVLSVADAKTNAQVFKEAETRRTFCNAVDDVDHCSCYASAIVRRGPLQIAISTAGKSPALAQRLRKELEEQFGEEYAQWLRRLGELRNRLFQDKEIDGETRRTMLHEQASASAFESFRGSLNEKSSRQNPAGDPEG
jgi:precorrin-2 dehydrogenase/sirohydrochlorin ferrochelatase